jgi:hypothetical protein
MLKGFLESFPKESMVNTLRGTRAAVENLKAAAAVTFFEAHHAGWSLSPVIRRCGSQRVSETLQFAPPASNNV